MTLTAFPGHFDRLTLHGPAVVASTGPGSVQLDLRNYSGHGKFFLAHSAPGSGVTLNAKLQHSDTQGGAYTDVAGASFAAGVANTAHDKELAWDLDGLKPFVQIHFTVTGGTGTGVAYAGLAAQRKYNHPA